MTRRAWAERLAELAAARGRARGQWKTEEGARGDAPCRILVLGTGTEIGKTFISTRALGALAARGARALGVKPVESGLAELRPGEADYERLGAAGIFTAFPCYGLPEPLSPHLAARRAGRALELSEILEWTQGLERARAPEVTWVETAGGAFSPLSETMVNADLIRALEPSLVVLVAPDRLGVLHDVRAALSALEEFTPGHAGSFEARRAPPVSSPREAEHPEGSAGETRGSRAGAKRTPVHVVLLSASRPDSSTGTNRAELERVVLPRFTAPDGAPIELLVAPAEP